MAAEDYQNDIGFGSGNGSFASRSARPYKCNFCSAPITFNQRKPFNADGTPHRCKKNESASQNDQQATPQATLYAMAAMNAIISAQIQKGGIDHIHHMNFYDVADAAWQCAAAMVSTEKSYRADINAAARE